MQEWNIYRGDREYARTHGDPLIGTVSAETKEDAQRIASRQFNMIHSPWAVEKQQETFADQRMAFGEHVTRIARTHRVSEDGVRDALNAELARAMKTAPYQDAVYLAASRLESQLSHIRQAVKDGPAKQHDRQHVIEL